MVVFPNDTVTLFNLHLDPETETENWSRTVLTNVSLLITKGANRTKSGLEEVDSASLSMDADSYPSDKTYVGPVEWNSGSDSFREITFTFQSGKDFFVDGDLSNATLPDEDLFDYMVSHYDKVFTVTSIDEYWDVMPHFEIGGK